jgi:hypothetical protein
MALRIEWLGVAEGCTHDARGALTLVGVNQNVIQAPRLPHIMKEVFVLYVADEDGDGLAEGTEITVDFRLESPTGAILSAARSSAKLAQRTFPTIPAVHLQFVAEAMVAFDEYGIYVVKCTVEAGGRSSVSGEKKLYVIEPSPSSGNPLQGVDSSQGSVVGADR